MTKLLNLVRIGVHTFSSLPATSGRPTAQKATQGTAAAIGTGSRRATTTTHTLSSMCMEWCMKGSRTGRRGRRYPVAVFPRGQVRHVLRKMHLLAFSRKGGTGEGQIGRGAVSSHGRTDQLGQEYGRVARKGTGETF